jgi:NitT/TauT family transport system ATP-binding protein
VTSRAIVAGIAAVDPAAATSARPPWSCAIVATDVAVDPAAIVAARARARRAWAGDVVDAPAHSIDNVEAAIQMSGVSATYGARPVVVDVDLDVAAGEVVALIGRSGTGKTTILRLVAGLIAPTTGTVRLLGTAPEVARRQKRLGLVGQDARLHPWRTVLENVRLPLEVNKRAPVNGHVTPTQWLERVGVADAAAAYPHQLSGGMRQRVALARALVVDPEVLLMDEPLASLDELTREDLRTELLRMWQMKPRSVLYVTHDVQEAVMMADRVAVLAGRPARLVAQVPIALPRPRSASLRRDPIFHDLVERVRGHLA